MSKNMSVFPAQLNQLFYNVLWTGGMEHFDLQHLFNKMCVNGKEDKFKVPEISPKVLHFQSF